MTYEQDIKDLLNKLQTKYGLQREAKSDMWFECLSEMYEMKCTISQQGNTQKKSSMNV